MIGEYFFDQELVHIGRGTYGTLNIVMFSGKANLTIGSYCSIASNVTFIVSGEHDMSNVSTYPFKRQLLSGSSEAGSKGDIVVADDVWFGFGSTILSGVRIGQGAVVAAGAVVTRDVEPYSIVAGVPVKKVGDRFAPEVARQLLQISWNEFDEHSAERLCDVLYTSVSTSNVASIVDSIKHLG